MKGSRGENPVWGGAERRWKELWGRREGSHHPFFWYMWHSCVGQCDAVMLLLGRGCGCLLHAWQYGPEGVCGKGPEALGAAPWVGSHCYGLQVCLADHPAELA